MSKRTTFTTTIDPDIQKEFKKACVNREEKMNEALERYMKFYINGNDIVVNQDDEMN